MHIYAYICLSNIICIYVCVRLCVYMHTCVCMCYIPPAAPCVVPFFFLVGLFFCYVYANIRSGPHFFFIFKPETFVFQHKMRPLFSAAPCVVSFVFFLFFFATSRLIFVLGLIVASLARPKRLFTNIQCGGRKGEGEGEYIHFTVQTCQYTYHTHANTHM